MKKNSREAESELLVKHIVEGLQEKKAKEIISLDLRNISNAVCEFYVVCTGDSNTHVNALAGSVEKEVLDGLNDKPWHVEGTTNAEWVLMDYVSVAVHIFQREPREFYNIESLWADAATKEYDEVA